MWVMKPEVRCEDGRLCGCDEKAIQRHVRCTEIYTVLCIIFVVSGVWMGEVVYM